MVYLNIGIILNLLIKVILNRGFVKFNTHSLILFFIYYLGNFCLLINLLFLF